jgi:hypothetical protein
MCIIFSSSVHDFDVTNYSFNSAKYKLCSSNILENVIAAHVV